MADDTGSTETSFLRRWSQRKLAAAREELPTAPNAVPPATPNVSTLSPGAGVRPAASTDSSVSSPAPAPELPAVDSLTFDSDFTAFLKPDVDPVIKRRALKKLFADPRFNVMDGLDVYIDDYGKFEPMPPELVAQLNQAKFLFDPPKTRVNEHGHVEDVPDEPPGETVAEAGDAAETPAQIVDNATIAPLAEAAVPPVKLPARPASEES